MGGEVTRHCRVTKSHLRERAVWCHKFDFLNIWCFPSLNKPQNQHVDTALWKKSSGNMVHDAAGKPSVPKCAKSVFFHFSLTQSCTTAPPRAFKIFCSHYIHPTRIVVYFCSRWSFEFQNKIRELQWAGKSHDIVVLQNHILRERAVWCHKFEFLNIWCFFS